MQTSALPGESDWDEDLFRTSSTEPRHVLLLSHDEVIQAMSRNTWRLFEHLDTAGLEPEQGTRTRKDDGNWARWGDTVFFSYEGHRLELLNELCVHLRGTALSLVSLFRPETRDREGSVVPRALLATSLHEPGSIDWSVARFGVTHYRRSNLLAQLKALTMLEPELCFPQQRLAEISQSLEP